MFFLNETCVKICLSIFIMVFTGLLVIQPAYAHEREPHGGPIMHLTDKDQDGYLNKSDWKK